jgi:CelD/BcsL family acetyltransferase involved in cellulose biosynthesis
MTVLTTNVGKLDARAKARASGFRVELVRDWKQALARWNDISPPTPFQHPQWVAAWYEAFSAADGIEPLIAIVTDASTGEQAALLPLIRRRQNNIAIIEFADLDLPAAGSCGTARCQGGAGAVARSKDRVAPAAWPR